MTFLLANWRIVLFFMVIVALGGWGKVMQAQRDYARNEFAEFKLAAKAAALEQEARTNKIVAEHNKAKEKADAENRVSSDRLRATVARLQRERADRSLLPATPAGSRCPDGWACFDRAELAGAIRDYDEAVQGIAVEGSQVAIDLETAKAWAREVLK